MIKGVISRHTRGQMSLPQTYKVCLEREDHVLVLCQVRLDTRFGSWASVRSGLYSEVQNMILWIFGRCEDWNVSQVPSKPLEYSRSNEAMIVPCLLDRKSVV